MARQLTIYFLLILITALIGTFFVVDRGARTPERSANAQLAERLSVLTFGCPGVATLEVRDARQLCLNRSTDEVECLSAYRRVADRFSKAAGRSGASDRCKITVENTTQMDLNDAARLLSGQPRPGRRELDGEFREMQKALGQPEVGCSNLNEACAGSSSSNDPASASSSQPLPTQTQEPTIE